MRQFIVQCGSKWAAVLAGLLLATGAQAEPPRRLNDTGATQCVLVSEAGGEWHRYWSSDCAGSGQDAAFGRDVTHPSKADGRAGFSFVKVCGSGERAGQGRCPAEPVLGIGAHKWACTFDRVTGMLWEMKQAGSDVHGTLRRYTRLLPGDSGYGGEGDSAYLVAAAQAEALCGVSDWRLPEASELQSLGDYGQANFSGIPMIDAAYFPNTRADAYWSGSAFRGGLTGTVYFKFLEGAQYGGPNTNRFFVRVVSSSPWTARPRYAVSADGQTVRDRRTSLEWQRCTDGTAWDGQHCSGTPVIYGPGDALRRAAHAGCGWRAPNAKELGSIIDHAAGGPTIDPAAFPDTPAAYFWTNTPGPSLIEAYVVGFDSGSIINEASKSPLGHFLLRLVRDTAARCRHELCPFEAGVPTC